MMSGKREKCDNGSDLVFTMLWSRKSFISVASLRGLENHKMVKASQKVRWNSFEMKLRKVWLKKGVLFAKTLTTKNSSRQVTDRVDCIVN